MRLLLLFIFSLIFTTCCFAGYTDKKLKKAAGNDTSITCTELSYKKNFIIEGNVFCNDVKLLSNGNTCVVGSFDKYPTLGCAFIAMLDKNNDTLWVKSYAFDFGPDSYSRPSAYYDGRFEKVIETSDHKLLIMATDWENLIVETDLNGNLLWFNQFTYDASTTVLFNVIEAEDKGFICCGIADYHSLIVKLDKNGKQVWAKNYVLDNYLGLIDIVQYGSNLYAIGKSYDYNSIAQSVLCKIDESTGELVWTKGYGKGKPNEDVDIHFCTINKQNNNTGLIINGVKGSEINRDNTKPLPFHQLLITIDTSGTVKRAIQYKQNKYSLFYDQLFTLPLYNPASKLMVQASLINPSLSIDGQYEDIHLIKLNSNYEPQWAYVEPSPVRQDLQGFDINLAGDVLFTGFSYDYTSMSYYTNGFVHKYPPGGAGSCTAIPIDMEKEDVSFSVNDATAQAYTAMPYTEGPHFPFIQIPSPAITIQDECNTKTTYSLSHITGNPSVCSNTSAQYKAVTKKDGKRLATIFTFDTSFAVAGKHTDSTITLQFKKAGSFYIRSGVTTNCGTLSDSLLVNVSAGATAVELGTDKALCNNATDTLTVDKGYASYTWQDGSHDQMFIVKTPGTYFVSVTDVCGLQSADTIHVVNAASVELGFDPSYSKCSKDTLYFPVSDSLTQFYFLPATDIIHKNNTIVAWPNKSADYTIRAATKEGCETTEQLNIMVNVSPFVYLGSDTAVCEGETVTLQLNPGFTSYKWSDGTTGSMKTIENPGRYWVTVTDSNKCSASDSINIIVYNNPNIELGEDRNICTGSTYILTPGNSYSAYKWQDGSTISQFIATSPGLYWVTVKDENKCIASDTITITGYNTLPANFLKPQDSLCSYEGLQLQANGIWASYLWSNGATSPAIRVTKPGDYRLTVSSFEGCYATDTMHVSEKTCVEGIYFPSAFTPNHDGKNDVFKPIVHIPLEKYFFAIYNRYGKTVFTSGDVTKGWDGKIDAFEQGTTTFVWYCRYKIAGSKEVVARGTVTAIY